MDGQGNLPTFILQLKGMKSIESKIKRKEMVAAGAYDGRFRQRTVVDKKKQANKRWARQSS